MTRGFLTALMAMLVSACLPGGDHSSYYEETYITQEGFEVPSLEPPDNWSIITGVWGTDANRTEALIDTRTGSFAVALNDTLLATKLESGFTQIDADFGGLYQVDALFKADSNAGGDLLLVEAVLYDGLEKPLIAVPVFMPAGGGGTVTTVNVFQLASVVFDPLAFDATARLAKLEISKSATAFNSVFEYVRLLKTPRFFASENKAIAQVIPDNVWTTIVDWDMNAKGIPFVNATGIGTIKQSGVHHLTGRVTFDDLTDGQKLEIRLRAVIAGGPNLVIGGTVLVGAAGDASVSMAELELLQGGDTVELQVRQSGASTSRTVPADNRSSFNMMHAGS